MGNKGAFSSQGPYQASQLVLTKRASRPCDKAADWPIVAAFVILTGMKALLIICGVALLGTGYMIVAEWGKPSRSIIYQPNAADLVRRY